MSSLVTLAMTLAAAIETLLLSPLIIDVDA
jgi:hypothetical protein